jgi:transcriptional regulator with XRE-family HTH domain
VARYVPAIVNFLGYDPWPAGETLGGQLHKRRRSLGLTQRRAAAVLRLHEGTYLRYERDEWHPKGERLARIEAFLGGHEGVPRKR